MSTVLLSTTDIQASCITEDNDTAPMTWEIISSDEYSCSWVSATTRAVEERREIRSTSAVLLRVHGRQLGVCSFCLCKYMESLFSLNIL